MDKQLLKYTDKLQGRDRLLICFHAGGSGASQFKNWPAALGHLVDVVAVQLPGREDRLDEPPYTRIESVLPELERQLEKIHPRSIVLFGYCMGGLIAFELARTLSSKYPQFNLEALIIAASAEPNYAKQHDLNRIMSDEELRSTFSNLFFKRHGIVCQEEYLDMILPILKSDREINLNYDDACWSSVKCPLFVFGGEKDEGVGKPALMAWQTRTVAEFALTFFPGDHMFIETDELLLLSKLENILKARNG